MVGDRRRRQGGLSRGRPALQRPRPVQQFAETAQPAQGGEVGVARDHAHVAEAAIDRLAKRVERLLLPRLTGEGAGEVVAPGRVVGQQRDARAAGMLHGGKILLPELALERLGELQVTGKQGRHVEYVGLGIGRPYEGQRKKREARQSQKAHSHDGTTIAVPRPDGNARSTRAG